jgi:1-acyl-sn-glycerol-3-phosphate acyltransferase
MKNLFIPKLTYKDVDSFTSDIGMTFRRILVPFILKLGRLFNRYNLIIEQYPNLDPKTPYIFASNHVFKDDIENVLYAIKRQAYCLSGSQDSLENDPSMYGLWLSGIIPFLLDDEESRRSTLPKMERVLNHGNSVLIFPEGSWNMEPNKIVKEFYFGAYNVHARTGIPIVPISIFREDGKNEIYFRALQPVDLRHLDYLEGTRTLRDMIATEHFDQIEKYASRIKRSELGSDPKLDFLKQKRTEALAIKASREQCKNEFISRIRPDQRERQAIVEDLPNVNITKHNYMHVLPLIKELTREDRYDFVKFMEETADAERAKIKKTNRKQWK